MDKSRIESIINQVKKDRTEIEGNDSNIPQWEMYYNGYDPSFHRYSIYNGEKYIDVKKKSLKMAKRICEDWSSLLWSEKLDLSIADKDKLYRLLYQLKFWEKGNKAVELGFALSFSALAVDIKGLKIDETGIKDKSNARIQLSKFNAKNIIPITIDNGDVTECAFTYENARTLYVNAHIMDEDGNYHIVMYKETKSLNPEATTIDFNTLSKIPLFAIIQPNIENNLDLNSDRPISVFANAIDQIQALDNKYDAFDSEYVLGRKRIYVSAKLNKIVYETDANGNEQAIRKRTFEGTDQIVYQLPEAPDEKPLIWSPNDPLRSQDLITGIQTELQILGSKCGLGNDYYNFEKGRVMTATQVISEKSDTFRNLRKHQLLLENSVKAIVRAIIYANNTFTNNEQIKLGDKEEIEVIFDDSIIEDKTSEKTSDRTDLQNGIMSMVEYRMKWYGEDEKTARETVYKENGNVELAKRIQALTPALQTGTIPAKLFIKYAYTKEDITATGMSEDELAEYIEERIKSGESITADDIMGMGGFNPNPEQAGQTE